MNDHTEEIDDTMDVQDNGAEVYDHAHDLEEFEQIVRAEEDKTRRTMLRWAAGISAVVIVSWAGWVSQGIIASRTASDTLTRLEASFREICDEHKKDMETMRQQFMTMDTRIDAMPPKDFRDRVEGMERRLMSIDADLKTNGTEHARIITTMDEMRNNQGRLDVTQQRIEANQQGMIETLIQIKALLKPREGGGD